ncbi:MAG: DUF5668 domain-containing protein, partial [Candidatus Korobacteraceae bacterium]
MSCAVHAQAPTAAYCRICGTALCEACKRPIKGVIYCENCVAERLQGAEFPQPGPNAAARAAVGVPVRTSPNPGLAVVLAVLFPFGVGQVYCGLYAKGLAHLLVFTTLIWGVSNSFSGMEIFFALGIAFFYFYQIVDAYRSAHAILEERPAPDPFDLGSLFSSGRAEPVAPETQKLPTGALVLIALGAFFLLHNLGMLHFYWFGHYWPALLIVLGVWLLLRRKSESEVLGQPPGAGPGVSGSGVEPSVTENNQAWPQRS